MAFFGAFCPLPGALGGNAEEGWDAAAFLRTCADVAAQKRTLPFARIEFTKTDGAIAVATSWTCKAPTTTGNAPVMSGTATVATITFPEAPENELGEKLALKITSAEYSPFGTCALVNVTGPNTITLTIGGSVGTFSGTVTINAQWGPVTGPEIYGGSPNKRNSTTEKTPYAWMWYKEYEASLGDAYSRQLSGLVHARKLAASRVFGAVSRAIDCYRANSTPGTSSVMLNAWAQSVKVPVTDASKPWTTRKHAATMFAAEPGAGIPMVERAVYSLLGDTYVGIITFDADHDPGVWPSWLDLGGGVWATDRARLIVDVIQPADENDLGFRELVQVQLIGLLDRILPAHMMFDWTSTTTNGFRVGISRIGIDGL